MSTDWRLDALLKKISNDVKEYVSSCNQTSAKNDESPSVIDIDEVCSLCRMAKSSIYAMVRKGTFPSPIKMSSRRSVWVYSEIIQYINAKLGSRVK